MNGIPPGIGSAAPSSTAASSASTSSSLDALRNHPQFNDLRRLVQSNPSTLQTVLAQIGQQQPDLLRAINENQAEFLRMMNEPVGDAGNTAAAAASSSAPSAAAVDNSNNNPFAMDPTQLSSLLSSLPPAELASMAQMMGMTVDQLRQTSEMISNLPPDQLSQYMNMASSLRGMDMAHANAMMSGGGGQSVLRLNEEEMAAVNRLTEMGFDRTEAAQAYLACDKNEALAANLLMDGGFGGGDMGGFGDDDLGGDGEGGDDGDMYD
ncbi:hypothetical protein ACHAXN_001732 [Cyclotella atomus]